MKTFKDIVVSSGKEDIIKIYNIDERNVILTGTDFKSAIALSNGKSLSHLTKILTHNKFDTYTEDILWVNITKVSKNILSVSFYNHCSRCNDSSDGEIECIECEGTGDAECYECNTVHACENCNGMGYIECECGGEFDENEVIFSDEININQGELF